MFCHTDILFLCHIVLAFLWPVSCQSCLSPVLSIDFAGVRFGGLFFGRGWNSEGKVLEVTMN